MGLAIKHPTGVILELRRGSLLDQKDVSVIVNAANRQMRGGGGIDGAIHAAAGDKLMEALVSQAPNGCLTGGVITTEGFDTGFDMILHTPGPVWEGGKSGEFMALSMCYLGCLQAAARSGASSIGFCSISTGIHKFPLVEAVPTALGAVCCWLRKAHETHPINRIVFAMYKKEEYDAYYLALRSLQATWDF
jgi:O-acetyl-ADP-ribose deacetylase (regulator of RNase III)